MISIHLTIGFGRHTAQSSVVIVVQLVDSLDLATNVELLGGLVQELDGRVLGVTTEDELTLLGPESGGNAHVSPDPQKKKLEPLSIVQCEEM